MVLRGIVFALPRLGCLLGLVALNGCATLQVASTWVRETNAASDDNAGQVWPAWTYINDGNAVVAANNDSQYLHVMVRFRTLDTKWARNCAMTGLTVWLNAAGKKKKDFGITIASGPTEGDFLPWADEESSSAREDAGFPMRPRLDGGLTVNYPDRKVAVPADGSLGPSALFETQNGVCTYDLSVPIIGLGDQRLGLSIAPGSVVMVGITAGPSAEERAAMQKRSQEGGGRPGAGEEPGNGMGVGPPGGGMGGGPPGGGMGGGPPGGGMGGGPPGGGMGGGGPGAEMQESPEDWLKLRLAKSATSDK
jgi:hypothetical protein